MGSKSKEELKQTEQAGNYQAFSVQDDPVGDVVDCAIKAEDWQSGWSAV